VSEISSSCDDQAMRNSLQVALGAEGGGCFDAECQLLAGLVTMKVVDRVVEEGGGGLSDEASAKLKAVWMDKLSKHGGLSLDAVLGRPSGGPTQLAQEAKEMREASKYLRTVLPPRGRVNGCEGTPAPTMLLTPPPLPLPRSVAHDSLHDGSHWCTRSFALTGMGLEGRQGGRGAGGGQVTEVLNVNKCRSITASNSATDTDTAHARKICDSRWADELGYPFHGLLVRFRPSATQTKTPNNDNDNDSDSDDWLTGRINQLVFGKRGLLESVSVRCFDGQEHGVGWPSRDIRCVVEPSLPAPVPDKSEPPPPSLFPDVADVGTDAADLELDDCRNEETEETEEEEEGEEEDEEEGEGEGEEEETRVAEKLGIEGLGVDIAHLKRCSGPMVGALKVVDEILPADSNLQLQHKRKHKHKLPTGPPGSLPEITNVLLEAPPLHLPLPVPGQREALQARLDETESYFEELKQVKSKRPRLVPTLPDGTVIDTRKRVVNADGRHVADGDTNVDGLEIDPHDDPEKLPPEPSCTVLGVCDGVGLTRRKRVWTGVLRDAYLIVQGVSTILPQCQIRLDPTAIIDPTQPLRSYK